ncbi:MAG TPA: aminotransferase class I/II-fold pyridoxal phosphate-dependent enzyme [Candidatus Acidoferrum sp.]|jgi:aspartate/methionine/tyrosine aminotransferase|nr:aminotransferase class I/II-fold pyridoxal phosphate-dependent enzyme [Candidatus Acidoferrum sp.]
MHIKPFRIEQYFGKYEFTAKYLLSSSDAESRTIQELLDLEPGAHEGLLKHWCGYTESPGAPALREVISGMYRGIEPQDALVLAATEEGIFVLYHALLSPGDHVIVETPCYESALEVARSTGARVSEWRRDSENGWAHDLAALEKLIEPRTKIIYINTPHNPTGLLMPVSVFQQVTKLAARSGIILFCDEVYRELEHDPVNRLPAACEVYERAVSLGSMSKTYGLPGLRLGWLVSKDAEIVRRCLEFRYYTTICCSAPSEFLSALALRHREVLVERNREIVLRNLPLLDSFFRERPNLFAWVRPNASPIGFVRYKPQRDVLSFCEEVVNKAGVLLLPGTVYDQPQHIRFGYGRKNMPQALAQFTAYLDAHSEFGVTAR